MHRHTVDCVGFANSCSAFYKPQAMNNINDCAIQPFGFCCNYIHVLWFGKPCTIIFAKPTQSTVQTNRHTDVDTSTDKQTWRHGDMFRHTEMDTYTDKQTWRHTVVGQ